MAEVDKGYQSSSHSKWDYKYHVVFIPKKRRKVLFQQAQRFLGAIFLALAQQKECQILEGPAQPWLSHTMSRYYQNRFNRSWKKSKIRSLRINSEVLRESWAEEAPRAIADIINNTIVPNIPFFKIPSHSSLINLIS